MMDDFPLPPELQRLEKNLAARPRGQPSQQLKERCRQSLRAELRRQRTSSRWAFAVAMAATVLVGLNLSLIASQATDYGLRLDGRCQTVEKTSREIRQLLPEIPPHEAMRQAVLLRARAGMVPCPNVPANYVVLDKSVKLIESDL